MSSYDRPPDPNQPPVCPHCGSASCERLPASVLGSTERWFECRICHRLWMEPLDGRVAPRNPN